MYQRFKQGNQQLTMNILISHNWLKDFVDTDAKPQKIAELLSLHSFSVEQIHKAEDGDAIYEIEITPNRPDAMSILGIARELGVVLPRNNIKAQFNDNTISESYTSKQNNLKKPLQLNVKIKNPNLAPRFTAIVLKNIKVGESPQYIKERLQKVGIRPLNNVIDITNYLMVERGQPMHAFDYDKIHNANMILREAEKGETVTTLDGEVRELPQGAIVIDDGKKLIDLCGIMGGENSKVDGKTNKVVLFVQIYDPLTIRKTVQELAFRTDAATRFEKGMDPRGVIPALNQAAGFLIEEANGEIASNLVDIENKKYEQHSVNLTPEAIGKTLGVEVETEEIEKILSMLGFKVTISNKQSTINCRVPSWRSEDIVIPEDLIEEVARIQGYHNLPINLPPLPNQLPQESDAFNWEDRIKQALKGHGYSELYTYSFTNKEVLEKAHLDSGGALEIENPLTADLTHLRPSLLPQMLEIVKENKANFPEQNLFQLSRIFTGSAEEKRQLALTLYSAQKSANQLFFQAKGVIEAVAEELSLKDLEFAANTESNLWRNEAGAAIIVNGAKVGELGLIDKNTAAVLIDAEKLLEKAAKINTYTTPPQHPPVIEDLTIVADKDTLVGELAKTIKSVSESEDDKITVTAEFSKIYRDEELKKKNKKAVTFNIRYRSDEKTLSDEEVKEVREAILEKLKEKHGAELRS